MLGDVLPPERAPGRQTDIQRLDVRTPHEVAESFHEVRQSDGGHEQNDRFLVDQVFEDQLFDQECQQDHDTHGEENCQDGMKAAAPMMDVGAEDGVDQMGKTAPGRFAGRPASGAANSAITPWAKLKMPEALKISTEAQRNQRIHDAGHQPVEKDLDEIEECRAHADNAPQS